MLPMQRHDFAEWLPDQPSYRNPGALEAKNALPQRTGYRDFRALSALTDAVGSSENILGGIWTAATGTVEIIVGTPTRLLRLNASSWTVVGSGYPSVESWEFVDFGVFVYAVAPGQDVQVIDLSAGAPAFATATGSPSNPPRAKRAAVVRDFVVLGALDSDERLVQWSGYNNANIWDANSDPSSEADSQVLFTGGKVQKVVGGPFGLVFQENQIQSMDYVGPPYGFSFTPLDRERGALSGDGVVAAGDRVFFLGQDGFFMIMGRQFVPIGAQKVNRWFFDNVAASDISNVRAAVDRRNQLVFWAFKSDASLTQFDLALVYNYEVNRWSYVEIGATNIMELRPVGYSIDSLDPIYPNIDTSPFNLDDPALSGGQIALFGATTGGELGTFSGAALAAVLDTREFDGGHNHRLSVSSVRPLVEGTNSSVEIQLGTRDALIQSASFTPSRVLNSGGEAAILADARYHRVRANISGGFDHAEGVDVMARSSGRW